MADWSLLEREWLSAPPPPPAPYDYQYPNYEPYYQEKPQPQMPPPPPPVLPPPPPPQPRPMPPPQQQQAYTPSHQTLTLLLASSRHMPPPDPMPVPVPYIPPTPRGDNPREIRNRAEKQRRDRLNHSIAELASMVPPVVSASRKIDKTGVLRLTAHYLRSHQYVFGDSIDKTTQFSVSSTMALLRLLNGFLLTTTYKGLVVVVSQNVQEYLGYTELDLLGQNLFNMTHEDDRQMLREMLMPKTQKFGKHGELLLPDDEGAREQAVADLANEKRRFIVRFKKLGQRSEPSKYVTCHVEGSLRMSDRACRGYNRCCRIVRRARARSDNPCTSGNDVVFIGVVRPTAETFLTESAMEYYKMEYRTRHSIDGEIIQCEQRIALVTGYMLDEVFGVNAMNFIHRDEVHWVVTALGDMYKKNLLFGESCYRLITKNGQFIYMSTRGRLDVNKDSRAAMSFVCTNTMVSETEGKELIKMMKEKFTLSDNCPLPVEDTKDTSDDKVKDVALEDPRQLEKVILHLVTDLPTLDDVFAPSTSDKPKPKPRFAIIPHRKSRILSAIDKIYTVIEGIPKPPTRLRIITEDEVDDYNDGVIFAPLPLDDSYLTAEDTLPELPVVEPEIFDFPNPPHKMTYYDMMSGEQPKFEKYPTHEGFQEQMISMPGTSATGVKRTNHFEQEDQDTSTKKKVINATEQVIERMSPSLEMFFDEATLNTQIESAIDSLEYNIDPNFPDLLISNEFQDILGNIERQNEDIDF